VEPTRDLIVITFQLPPYAFMGQYQRGLPIRERMLYRLAKGSEAHDVPPCDFDPHKCWPWPGARNEAGYGKIASDPAGESYAHRIMFREFVGPIPDDHDVEHSCHTDAPLCGGGPICPHRACCNPNHTEAVEHAENMERAGGTRPRGKKGETCAHEIFTRGCRLCYNRQQREWAQARRLRRGQQAS
jgi:hypothetical protein